MSDGSVTIETKLDDSGAKKGLGNLSSTLSKVGKGVSTAFSVGTKAIAGVATVATAGVGSFLALGEATQETREDMGKLETAFKTAGFSSQTAQKSYEGMVGILGETDQSVEAVNHLAKLTKSEEELSEWTNIAAGVYATFGDSLPLEGLTEAANETAKVGQVTGPLADALNWAGISEDKFNQQLASCNSEQERSTLITKTLSGLYKEAGDTYSSVNKDLIEARQATANFNSTLADLGALAMPMSTSLKNAFSGAVQSILPEIGKISQGIAGIFNGQEGAENSLLEGIGGLVNQLSTGITTYLPKILEIGTMLLQSILQGIQQNLPQLAQCAISIVNSLLTFLLQNLPLILNMGMQFILQLILGIAQSLPQLIPQALECILTIVQGLIDNIDLLIDAGIELIIGLAEGLINAIPVLIEKIPIIIQKLIQAIVNNLPKIIEMGIRLLVELGAGLIAAIPQLIEKIPIIIQKLVQAIINNLPKIIEMGIRLLVELGAGLIAAIPQLIAMIPQIISAIINAFFETDWGEIGLQLLQGLLEGFSNAGNIIWNAIKKVGNSMIDGIKSFFGIHSPSKVFMALGKYLPQGFAVGINKESKSAIKSTQKLNNAILDNFNLNNMYSKMRSAVEIETSAINTDVGIKAIIREENRRPRTVNNDNGTVINNTQNFYETNPTPYEQQKQAKQQLRRLAYGL